MLCSDNGDFPRFNDSVGERGCSLGSGTITAEAIALGESLVVFRKDIF